MDSSVCYYFDLLLLRCDFVKCISLVTVSTGSKQQITDTNSHLKESFTDNCMLLRTFSVARDWTYEVGLTFNQLLFCSGRNGLMLMYILQDGKYKTGQANICLFIHLHQTYIVLKLRSENKISKRISIGHSYVFYEANLRFL